MTNKMLSSLGYKRTEYVAVAICTRYTPTYRTVYELNGDFYIMWRGEIVPVSKDRLIPKKSIVQS